MISADLKSVLDPCNVLPTKTFQGKEEDLNPKSYNKERKINDDLKKRHIFVDQINIISG